MEALGRTLNVQSAMDNVYVNLTNCQSVSFIGYLGTAAGDTYTLTEAKTAAGGSAQVLATVTRFHTSTGNGTTAWVLKTQAAASTVVTAASAAENMVVFEVDAAELSDGYKYLKVASTGAGTVTVVQHGLEIQRKPSNLAALGV